MQNIFFTITSIIAETTSTKTFYLSSPQPLKYKAGQFLTFLFNINGRELRRSYSLSSTPGVDNEVYVTIKRIENGAISRFIFDHLKEGDKLQSLAPAGRFTIEDDTNNTYFFIAAGSGITPIFSLLKQLLFQHDNLVILVYQNVSEATSIYRPQLLQLESQFSNRFKLVEVFSNPQDGVPQRLNNTLLEKIITAQSNNQAFLFYLCGPVELMRMVYFTLRVMGYTEEQIRKENFVVEQLPTAPFMPDTTPKNVVIHFNNQTHFLQVGYPHNILEIALKNNIQLPYSCRGGRCSACAARCTKGKVRMSINDVLTEKELANGLVLTCVGYPEMDVELIVE